MDSLLCTHRSCGINFAHEQNNVKEIPVVSFLPFYPINYVRNPEPHILACLYYQVG